MQRQGSRASVSLSSPEAGGRFAACRSWLAGERACWLASRGAGEVALAGSCLTGPRPGCARAANSAARQQHGKSFRIDLSMACSTADWEPAGLYLRTRGMVATVPKEHPGPQEHVIVATTHGTWVTGRRGPGDMRKRGRDLCEDPNTKLIAFRHRPAIGACHETNEEALPRVIDGVCPAIPDWSVCRHPPVSDRVRVVLPRARRLRVSTIQGACVRDCRVEWPAPAQLVIEGFRPPIFARRERLAACQNPHAGYTHPRTASPSLWVTCAALKATRSGGHRARVDQLFEKCGWHPRGTAGAGRDDQPAQGELVVMGVAWMTRGKNGRRASLYASREHLTPRLRRRWRRNQW